MRQLSNQESNQQSNPQTNKERQQAVSPQGTEELVLQLRRVALAYVCLMFHLNLSLSAAFTIPILPQVVGWVLLYRVLQTCVAWRHSLSLLQVPCVVLGVCSLTQFFPQLTQSDAVWMTTVTLVRLLLNLYFHYQFLTDFAAILTPYVAKQTVDEILWYRLVLTVGTTLLYGINLLSTIWQPVTMYVTLPLMLALLGVVGYLCWVLWRTARLLESNKKS